MATPTQSLDIEIKVSVSIKLRRVVEPCSPYALPVLVVLRLLGVI